MRQSWWILPFVGLVAAACSSQAPTEKTGQANAADEEFPVVCCDQVCPDGSTLYCESPNGSCNLCANYIAQHNGCTCPTPSCPSPMQWTNGACACPGGGPACSPSSSTGASVPDSNCTAFPGAPCGPDNPGCVPGTCTAYTYTVCTDACTSSTQNTYSCQACSSGGGGGDDDDDDDDDGCGWYEDCFEGRRAPNHAPVTSHGPRVGDVTSVGGG